MGSIMLFTEVINFLMLIIGYLVFKARKSSLGEDRGGWLVTKP